MSVMSSPFVKWPVAIVVGCCLVGVSPLGASFAGAVVSGYGEAGGIFVGVAPEFPKAFEEGRRLVEADQASDSKAGDTRGVPVAPRTAKANPPSGASDGDAGSTD